MVIFRFIFKECAVSKEEYRLIKALCGKEVAEKFNYEWVTKDVGRDSRDN